jgi:hypothetical protein
MTLRLVVELPENCSWLDLYRLGKDLTRHYITVDYQKRDHSRLARPLGPLVTRLEGQRFISTIEEVSLG